MPKCRCFIEHGDGDVEEIVQCNLCKAAPELLDTLKDAEKALERLGAFKPEGDIYDWLEEKISTVIEKAEKLEIEGYEIDPEVINLELKYEKGEPLPFEKLKQIAHEEGIIWVDWTSEDVLIDSLPWKAKFREGDLCLTRAYQTMDVPVWRFERHLEPTDISMMLGWDEWKFFEAVKIEEEK